MKILTFLRAFKIFFHQNWKKNSKSSHETKKNQVQFSHFSDFKNVARRGADTKARSNRISETWRKRKFDFVIFLDFMTVDLEKFSFFDEKKFR